MRYKLFLIVPFLLINGNLSAVWKDVIFTSNGEIVNGDAYVRVFVYDSNGSSTTVAISGGEIATLFSYDDSIVNITGGNFSSEYYSYHPENNDGDNTYLCPSEYDIYVCDNSTLNYSGSSINAILCEDSGTLNINGGSTGIVLADNAVVNITGGEITNIIPSDSYDLDLGNAHLYAAGGDFTGSVTLPDDFVMEFFGYGFSYDPGGNTGGDIKGTYGGLLEGYWENGTPFSVNFTDIFGMHSYDNVILHTIPEPDTVMLLVFGLAVLNRKRTRFS